MSTPDELDVLGPLPEGVAVLEASAGTGKTFTIAALTARYVAEGTPLEEILVITFTRLATGELRDRVRERLVSAERALDEALRGTPPPAEDALAVLLASGGEAAVRERHRRLARAVADFDAATITTTHGFCLDALGSLGFTGDVERGCVFTEDVSDIIGEVVDDLYVRRFAGQAVLMERKQAAAIAGAAIRNPSAALEPAAAPENTYAAMRVRLAQVARHELERRKRALSVMTYDDLLTRLEGTLTDEGGEAVARRLRSRYRVALVDEFQDTDPVQWNIMRLTFDHPDSTLVLIGDPKQAIYAFRGADVFAYLDAAQAARGGGTLRVNWRSDQRLLDAFDQVFGAAQLGHAGIRYYRVRAAEQNAHTRIHGAPVDAALRVRIVDRTQPAVGTTKQHYARKDPARRHIAADLAQEVVALLEAGTTVEKDGVAVALQPGDIAVLVRRNKDAATIRDALEAANVPAVLNGAGSVFATESARHWRQLLEALERPSSPQRAHAVALTPFVGWSAHEVAEADEERWEEIHEALHVWADVVRDRGVAALVETVSVTRELAARVLAQADGERALTDLRHIGQLLHAAATTEHLGVAALTGWLRRRIEEAEEEADEERSRRLESDDDAVQVLTIHRSKGLEFPVVLCPSLWDASWIPDDDEPVFFHDPDHGDRRTLDVGLEGSAFYRHRERHRDELRGEDLRLAYVAMTRAKHLVMLWWAGAYESDHSPLSRLVFAQGVDGEVPPVGNGVRTDALAFARFEELAAGAPAGAISVEWAALRAPSAWGRGVPPDGELEAAAFDRGIDDAWRRTSYSDITAFDRGPRVASEPEGRVLDDEPDEEGEGVLELPAEPEVRAVALAAMPGGTRVGSFVHDVLEAVDFAAEDLEAELAARVDERLAGRALDVGDPAVVAAGLAAALRTPLGPLAGDRALAGLQRADRLDEMAFELPLAGGDVPRGSVSPADIAAALERHLPEGDPLRAYAPRLRGGNLRPALRGYLTGSLDLVFRMPGDGGRARYAIADYKTNRLGDHLRPLTEDDHRPDALVAEMHHAHYALQGLLYAVALHRFLRWRLEGYDAERDLAGVFYLFVRGMTGPQVARYDDGMPAGVFAWRPPGALLDELSDLLDRGAVPA